MEKAVLCGNANIKVISGLSSSISPSFFSVASSIAKRVDRLVPTSDQL